ncbi:MAG: phenylalanine--tRNA ligase subunit alpha [Candidatus Phytoplasma australasiaticum]|uniref:Phenylalanine--tRNA ligase alpha subunit n=2 Tax=16SrII (Peanut WB group) TaxID=85621 RepID=A0A9K3SUW7_9MOLU|nr:MULTISPECIES: phenylalanine--tRNA ligase subunit alpha [Phytoplasma]MCG3566546.1 phenylalanine--tRNA ligase subunit alpha [Sesame phyllody phytoplasma]MDO8030942.1 phenylalanine--tRNA ligase subunit alpha [Candidatus Phytoplasma australasiaticum]MDO8031419.1 phenylalanine--tRNA ligase subunit alpha [Candidatus Phytoplasma australasiaticum]MDO8046460.1 phenylalanine--tRNA ligase subunit alpha [Candidatus Phytoplasma australasiaticum]MDO8053017.1 phenylalanine--tRNA ligase subunit alpha [Cand
MNNKNETLQQKILNLKQKIKEKIQELDKINSLHQLDVQFNRFNKYFIELFKYIKQCDIKVKKELGQQINELKKNSLLAYQINKTKLENKQLNKKIIKEKIDVTLPGFSFPEGSIHPLTQTIEELENFFLKMGYAIYESQEIETDLYNFELMNISKDHPARDMQDSFYLDHKKEKLLRTHVSSMQIKAMLQNPNKPLKIISSGNVYRRDKDDATHSHQFTQLDGFVIDYTANLENLKTTINTLIKHIFGRKQKIFFRPSYFPFTNPSLEVDLILTKKNKEKIYLEIMGAGLIHPNILKQGGFDPAKYQGFAFGMGIERIAMLKYQIEDIRDLYNNDLRFLKQFSLLN